MSIEQPAWDGTGVDPWLTSRLADQEGLAEGERVVRENIWSVLVEWLTTITRLVLAPVRPDPVAVHARDQQWAEQVKAFVEGPVRDVIGIAYRELLGDGYRYDHRPLVVEHMATVSNRLVRIPDETFDLVAGQIAAGATGGESIPEIAERVDEVLSATASERWPNRATVIARTETLGALNAGRSDAFDVVEEDLGTPFERMWLSTVDGRTRRTHREADGQRVPTGTPFTVGDTTLRYPGDPLGPPHEVIQCLRGDTVVEYGSIRAVTRRWYEGEMIEIRFSSGHKLAVTPNHPVLRADGIWTPASLIDKGNYCVGAFDRGQVSGQPHEDGRPTQVGEMYRAASKSQRAQRVRTAPPDFHGDGSDGDVEIVPIDGDLRFRGCAATDEQVQQFGLTLSDLASTAMRSADRRSLAARIAVLSRYGPNPGGCVCCGGQPAPFGRCGLGHPGGQGIAAATDRHAGVLQPSDDDVSGNAERPCYRQDTLAAGISGGDVLDVEVEPLCQAGSILGGAQLDASVGESFSDGCDRTSVLCGERWGALAARVSTNQVVDVDRYGFAGHVYNLDSGAGWYIGNCIALRNCRCTTLLVEPGEHIDLTHRQFRNY